MTEQPGDIEWLDLGPPERPRSPRFVRLSRPRLIGAAAIALTVAIAVTVAVVHRPATRQHAATRGRAVATTSPSSSLAADVPSITAAVPPAAAQEPRTTVVAPYVLGVHDGWELFGRGPGFLTRLQLASGRITVTAIPDLLSDGAVSFLLDQHAALVQPADAVTGYLVPDGGTARPLGGALASGGDVFPGPADGQFWSASPAADFSGGATLYLLDATGRRLGPRIVLPATTGVPLVADGSGYVIASGIGGSYDARPGSLRRITTGAVIAVGPTAWLVEECDDIGECSNILVDKATWTRQVIGPTTSPVTYAPGAVSPDGSHAVLLRASVGGGLRMQMLDVADGATHTIADVPDFAFGQQVVTFSPDGRWLFAASDSGGLEVYDAVTLRRVPLGVSLPPIDQIAIRPAP